MTSPARTLTVEVLASRASLGTSILLRAGGAALLVDCGDGTARALAERMPRGDLRAVAFTHGHPDHVGGLYSLLSLLRIRGQRAPLALIVPEGCREPGLLLEAWLARYGGSRPVPVRPRSLRPGGRARAGPLELRPFAVRHQGDLGDGRRGRLPAVGWQVRCGGRRVVISGDTGPCPELRRAVEGADLALIEASFSRPRPGAPELHLSVDEARELGRRARAYRLYHLSAASEGLVREGERAGRHVLRLSAKT